MASPSENASVEERIYAPQGEGTARAVASLKREITRQTGYKPYPVSKAEIDAIRKEGKIWMSGAYDNLKNDKTLKATWDAYKDSSVGGKYAGSVGAMFGAHTSSVGKEFHRRFDELEFAAE